MITVLLFHLLCGQLSKQWEPHDGFMQPVTALAQSSTGHLWVGTRAGLFLFDGNHFWPVRGRAGMEPTTSLLVMDNGFILVGVEDDLLVYNNGALIQTLDLPTRTLMSCGPYVFVGGAKGLARLMLVDGTFEKKTMSFSEGAVQSLQCDQSGRLWVGGDAGLFRFDAADGELPVQLLDRAVSRIHRPGSNLVRIDAKDWVTWDMRTDQIVKRDPLLQLLAQQDVGQIAAIVEDHSGNVYIAADRGLFNWSPATGGVNTLQNDAVSVLSIDTRQNLWVGGASLRLYFNWEQHLRYLADGPVKQFVVQSPYVVSGTDDRLRVYHETRRHMDSYQIPSSLHSLASSPHGVLVVLDSGLYRFWPEDGHMERVFDSLPTGKVADVLQLGARSFLLAGTWGVSLLSDGERLDYPNSHAMSVIHKYGQRLFVGGVDGLFRIDQSELLAVPSMGNTALDDGYRVYALSEGLEGLWVATSKGPALLASDASSLKLVRYTEPVYHLAAFPEHLWLGSSRGLMVVDRNRDWLFRFGALNGLSDFSCGNLVVVESTLYFADNRGLGTLNPYRLQQQWQGTLLLTASDAEGSWPIQPGEKAFINQNERVHAAYIGAPFPANSVMHRASPESPWLDGPIVLEHGLNAMVIRDPLGIVTSMVFERPDDRAWESLIIRLLIALLSGGIIWAGSHWFHKRRWLIRQDKQDREKNQFVATASHELRTPLNGIMGMAQAMLNNDTGNLDAFQKQRLEYMISCSARLNRLVDGMLSLTEGRFHELEINRQSLDPHHQVEMALDLIHPILAQSGKDIRARNLVPIDLPPVLADEDLLQQILINLLNNALKFTESGSIDVYASVSAPGWVRFEVRDTGIGIESNQQSRIFETFRQAKSTTTRPFEGAGLGLAISREILSRLGGEIWVESTQGKGSSFFFTLPAQEVK